MRLSIDCSVKDLIIWLAFSTIIVGKICNRCEALLEHQKTAIVQFYGWLL